MAINKVILLGNVGMDPEIRTVANGGKVANFTLATTERGYTLQNGSTIPERTEWHNCTVWGKGADVVERYVNKGTKLYIEGKIRTRSWDDNGVRKYKTEIQVENLELCDRKHNDDTPPGSTGESETADDLPF